MPPRPSSPSTFVGIITARQAADKRPDGSAETGLLAARARPPAGQGLRSDQIRAALDAFPYEEVVHRDNLVVISPSPADSC
jgi:hypothetical protein